MRIIDILATAYKNADPEHLSEEAEKSDISLKVSTSVILSIASLTLTILNFTNQNWFMLGTTAVLTVGFIFCAILCGIFKKRVATILLMSILIGTIFTIYALTGENEGFAILWSLLVPSIAMSLIGLLPGTVIGAYFLVFFIILFYTPMRSVVQSYYTETFCIRFPVLYLTNFVAAILLSAQKEYYYQKTERMAYIDSLTGLSNRLQYDLIKNELEIHGKTDGLTIVSIDINRLKYTNDTFGHQAGDELIIGAAECITEAFVGAESVSRLGGDEFCVLTYQERSNVLKQIDTLKTLTENYKGKFISSVSLSVGTASAGFGAGTDFSGLEKAADAAMYSVKEEYYRQNGISRR